MGNLEKWDEERKLVRNAVREDKKMYVKECIKQIGNPEGPENIWKAIDIIAPRKVRDSKALEKEDGEVCLNKEEEMEEIARLRKTS